MRKQMISQGAFRCPRRFSKIWRLEPPALSDARNAIGKLPIAKRL
jgi:hypothetical protein